MKKNKNTSKKSEAESLRQKAEYLLKKKPAKKNLSEAEMLKFIHELEVHQIELELLNEELMLARSETRDAVGKYAELYDFAPLGYFTLSKEGEIIELSLSGANMLNKERSRLKNTKFALFVSNDTKLIFNLFLEKVFNSKAKESCEVALSTYGNLPMYVYITGIVTNNKEQCFVTVIDITECKNSENLIKQSKKQLEQFNQHLVEAIENERAKISREIHDELGQLLSALKIDLGWTKDNVKNKAEVKKKIKGMTDIVDETVKIVQRISSDLRPCILDDLGLVPAIEWHCQKFEKRTGIKCLFTSDDVQSTNEKKNLAIYRILQEALTNVIRHANAKNVNINLYRAEDSIILEIIDDGIGMKQEKIDSYKSLGFIGIRERVKHYNGSLDITSAINKGTKLSIVIPFN